MGRIFKGFLSCSFSKEDEWIKNFFRSFIESFSFDLIVYDFQEPTTIPDGIKEQIRSCDFLIALVTKRFKLEGSDEYICPAWLSTEMAWANSYGKPIVTLIEKGVSLQGLPKIERYELFNREKILESLPLITKYLQKTKDFLIEHDITTSIPSPILIRNSIDSILEIQSRNEYLFSAQVKMTSLTDNLETCHHSTTLDEPPHELSVKPKKYEFVVLEKPKHVEVSYIIDRNDDDYFLWRIVFNPPLTEGESVKYYYKRLMMNNKPFTSEEAKKRVEICKFPTAEPVATTYWFIMYPTERLRFEVNYPAGYIVKSPKHRVDIGKSGNISKTEMQRLQEDKSFSIRRIADKEILILDIKKPFWGYKYWIIWTPPSESELPKTLKS